MAPKQQLEKLAWAWAETTDPANITDEHVETAFRVNFATCKRGVCRKNCAGNPHCFNGLGEREWQKEFEDSYWHDIADPSAEERKEGVFVGLQNLGATCYVNTFLQLWFANPVFRSAIFKWQEILPWEPMPEVKKEEDGEESASTSNALSEDLYPASVAGHLQLIFALLKFSVRRYIDPSPLMRFLELDTGQQQDAQEFSKLIVQLLEDTLRSQDDPFVANLIENQIVGSYSYITECSKCKGCSYSASQFYELDLTIKGQRTTIEECIEEYLQEEKLEGDNMYFCETCGGKQNACRRIKLTNLPPVLNLQLLRFVFERTTGHKKKLNSYLQFPEELNMGKYVGSTDDENLIYELQAVLIHRGPSAYSGHYIAHILDTKSDVWYKFNDEDTEKIGSRNLHLGNEEEIEGKSTAKKPRTPKGSHTSKNAYMLVYRRKGSLDPNSIHDVKLEDLPDLVKNHVEKDNKKFYEWVKEMTNMRDANVVKGKAKQQEVHELCKMMPVKKGESFELISTKWLVDWLRAETVPPSAVDNSQLFCGHGRVDPEKATKMKYISTQAAEVLYSKYGGNPRLSKSDFCLKCVQKRCREIHVKARVDLDSKVVTELLKDKSLHLDPEKCHWVGKKSLRSWRRLVIEQLEEDLAETKGTEDSGPSQAATPTPVKEDGAGPSAEVPQNGGSEAGTDVSSSTEKSSEKKDDSDGDENGLKFNHDLLCNEHGSLNMDESVRRLVSSDVWIRIKSYFPSCPEFKGTCSACQNCLRNHEESVQETEQSKLAAAQQKSNLLNLFHDRNRPVWSKNVRQLMVTSAAFVETWRSLLRDPGLGNILKEMNNRSLLCDHGGFLFEPTTAGFDRQSESALVLLWPEEWTELMKYYKVDVPISISRVEEDQHVTYISDPDVCQDCLQNCQAAFRSAMLSYDKAIIYVRKVINEKVKGSKVKDSSGTNSPVEELGVDKDPEFIQENGKRKKQDDGPAEKSAKIDLGVRRSSRHRKQRGEKEVEVSSTQTLWDLKMQLMKLFSAPPMDQHLMLEGVELKGDKQPLHSFNIFPESVLYLNVDEPCDDPMFLDDISQAGSIEVGFKGTGLMGR